ncbi:MAG: hypothetical protein JXB50_09285 [Spirochaetes bacterium]|nr:hypothetical protein [Spirochaetota bacterium]
MKIIIKLSLIFMILSIVISGCIVVADPDDIFLYDFGLTGEWSCVAGTSNLVIDNRTGYNITSGKYSIGSTEPVDWSVIPENLDFEETPLSNISSRSFTIGEDAQIDTNSAGAVTIWLKINSGSDYLIGAFDFEPGDDWELTVYTKI